MTRLKRKQGLVIFIAGIVLFAVSAIMIQYYRSAVGTFQIAPPIDIGNNYNPMFVTATGILISSVILIIAGIVVFFIGLKTRR